MKTGCLKKYLILGILFFSMPLCVYPQALVNNNGAEIYIKQGAEVYVRSNSVLNEGLLANAGLLEVEGDLVNNDTATGGGTTGYYRIQQDWENNAVFIADQSKVELYGGNQSITGNSVTRFYDLELSGSGVKTQTIHAEVSNSLALNDRELAINEYEMWVTNTDPAAITRTTGFASSLDTGKLSRNTDRVEPYLFPTGSSSVTARYRPVAITPGSSGNHTFGARLANTNATNEGFDRTVKEDSVLEVNPGYYHRLYRLSGASPADIVFYYDTVVDGQWEGVGHWQNEPQWEKVTAIAGNDTPFWTYTVNNWDDFSTPAFALIRLTDLGQIDTIIKINIRAILGGSFNTGSGLMRDDLRQAGYIPLTEPYTGMGFVQAGPGGGETVALSVLAIEGDSAIVDWVLVELRDKSDASNIIATRAALIQRDGDVVDTNGTSSLKVPGFPFDNYYVAIRHRNHFGVMMLDTVYLDNTAPTIDFTAMGAVTYGTNAQDTKGGKKVMWSGNALLDDVIKYSGIDNDRDPILIKIGGVVPTNVVLGYHREDITMDGVVKYSGLNNDRDIILQNIGGVVPTAVISEQMP